MQRDESLIYSILRMLRSRAPGSLEENRIVSTLGQASPGRIAHIREQLQYLHNTGMLKRILVAKNRTAYQLDWPGYDYLDGA
ncbi:hypothetical protein PQU95_08625 [Vogesella sp. DC21W]|uniref:Uncharacterized protein n=1 Tax=Vogesella aquatica TaxID=2984206 RepID=A0ABT5IYN1_9NEIS|nr:hypothetical protein [Vogesella aquatica]MDC7717273.1 hypothetical protein [Vogesella aquatica]